MAITIAQTSNPILVTGTTSASVALTDATRFRINRVLWLNPTTIGHKLALQDGNGKELVEFYCDIAGASQTLPFKELSASAGIYCDDMDSGTLYIYYN